MNYVDRLKARVKEEGITKTIKYAAYVFSNGVSTTLEDTLLDLRYSKRLLTGNQKTPYKHLGANDTYHTSYSAMSIIFKYIEIYPQDVLVDVGCGKGRVINYWLSRGYINRIVGLELDPAIASQTATQFAAYPNVSIIPGDAIENLPHDGTIFYFYNPFTVEKVAKFQQRAADLAKHRPIRIIYYNPKSIQVFDNANWQIQYINFENDLGIVRWGRLNKYHDLAIISSKVGWVH